MNFVKIDGSFGFPPQISIYVAASILIPASAWFQSPAFLLILIAIYFAYDILFLFNKDRFTGRNVEAVLGDLRAACGYLSYFLPLAAILMAFGNTRNIAPIFLEDPAIGFLLSIGVVSAAVATLFIPVQYRIADGTQDHPSWALKVCFVFVLFLQKLTITVFTSAVLRAGLVVVEGLQT